MWSWSGFPGHERRWERSSACTECVRAPTDTASTHVYAARPDYFSEMFYRFGLRAAHNRAGLAPEALPEYVPLPWAGCCRASARTDTMGSCSWRRSRCRWWCRPGSLPGVPVAAVHDCVGQRVAHQAGHRIRQPLRDRVCGSGRAASERFARRRQPTPGWVN